MPRSRLATLPTPLERGPGLPGGVRLWVKRDDLTGLGAGGNKARKLEFLCGEALRAGARSLVTVGAGQSNHCRMTAAAGAVLGLEVHLVLSGSQAGASDGQPVARRAVRRPAAPRRLPADPLGRAGDRPRAAHRRPPVARAPRRTRSRSAAAPRSARSGTSSPTSSSSSSAGRSACDRRPVVHTSSSGGTHAGLVAGRALLQSLGHDDLPDVLAIGVAKGVVAGQPDVRSLAHDALALLGVDVEVGDDAVEVDTRWLGQDYGVPTPAGDEAIRWAAVHGGWVLDRTYTGKGFAGLLGNAATGRWRPGAEVVFLHTGGLPAVFADDGAPGPSG